MVFFGRAQSKEKSFEENCNTKFTACGQEHLICGQWAECHYNSLFAFCQQLTEICSAFFVANGQPQTFCLWHARARLHNIYVVICCPFSSRTHHRMLNIPEELRIQTIFMTKLIWEPQNVMYLCTTTNKNIIRIKNKHEHTYYAVIKIRQTA